MKTIRIRRSALRTAVAAGSVAALATLGGALASADDTPSPSPIVAPAAESEPTSTDTTTTEPTETETAEPTETETAEPTETETAEPTETETAEPTETESPKPAFTPNPRAVANHNDGRGQDDSHADVRGGGNVDHRAGEHKAKGAKQGKHDKGARGHSGR